MKTKQEQINEMMLAVPQTIVAYDANPKGQHLYGEQRRQIAEALYEAGYRREATITSDFIEMVQRHAKLDVLNELKQQTHNYYPSIDSYCVSQHVVLVKDIAKKIAEVENAEDKC